MIDLLAIFKAITPENIQELPIVRVAMEIFATELEKNSQVALRISSIYEDFDEDDSEMLLESKYNLKTGLYLLYTNTLYTACSKLAQDPEVKKTLEKFNYTDAAIQNDLNVLINSEFLNSQRAFSQTVGTEKALHYMYSFAKYLETGAVRDDLEISSRDPFIMHYEGSLNKRTFENVVYPLAHPLGWAYSYYTVMTQVLRDYYGITLIYDVKKLWLVNNAKGKYAVFTEKSLEEVYEEFRNMVNPLTQTFFTDEITRNVQVYTYRRVIDYQRWEDEKGNWCQLFTFDDNMVLYHDGSKGTTTYTSYEDYIDGCKEPQNVWGADYAVVADIKQDVKFEYFDTYDLEKYFHVTRIRDIDHKIGDSVYMLDDITRAFGINGQKYLYNKGVDESRHLLVKSTDGVPVGGYWLPHHNTFDERLRHLEILSYRLYKFDVTFDNTVYTVVAYDDDLVVPEYDQPLSDRLKHIENIILPLTFVITPRGDDIIELLTANGSKRPTSEDVYERVNRLENIINEIMDVVVEYDDHKYKVLTRLYKDSPYTLSFEQDYVGNIKIYGSGYLEVDDNVRYIQEYSFDTKDYHGNIIKVELTDLKGQKIIVETDTMNRDAQLYITQCKLSTYGKLATNIVQTDEKCVKKFGLTVYGRYTANSNSDTFIYDVETFDTVTFSDNIETIYLVLEDEEGVTVYGDTRTDIAGNFIYTFDTSDLSGDMNSSMHNFKVTAYTMSGTKKYNQTYYKGNWLNDLDFDKTPTYITLPVFHKVRNNQNSYELIDIKTSQMFGLENVDVDIEALSEAEKENLDEKKIKTISVVKKDFDDPDNITIEEKTVYRNYNYIGEKTDGFYEPDKWAPDFFDKGLNDGEGGYLPYKGFISGNIIEGENYAKSTWEYYSEEEVFVGMGYRKHLIDTSDFYIMDSTRFCHDDFEILSLGDDFYLFSNDEMYLNSTDDEYLITDEDDKLTDAWGIKVEDGMSKEEYNILYTLNGRKLQDFGSFEDTLIPSKKHIDAFGTIYGVPDYVDVTIDLGLDLVGKEVLFEVIGDGDIEEGERIERINGINASVLHTVIESNGRKTIRVFSRAPYQQSIMVLATYKNTVTVPDHIQGENGVYDKNENKAVIEQTYHDEERVYKHDCFIVYRISEYIAKVETPKCITGDGYILRYTNLLPHSPVIVTEPVFMTGTADKNGVFIANFKPYKSTLSEVTHIIKYHTIGDKVDEFSVNIPYVNVDFTADSEVLNAFNPDFKHVSKLGYVYVVLTGCNPNDRLRFDCTGDCTLEAPEFADLRGDARFKVYAKEPFTVDPELSVYISDYEITKKLALTYNTREVQPVLTLPTTKTIYGKVQNTVDTDTKFSVRLSGLISGTIAEISDKNGVLQTKKVTNTGVDFIFDGVDYTKSQLNYTIRYRINGKDYEELPVVINVYQYTLTAEKKLSSTKKNGIDAYNNDANVPDTKIIKVSGGKPLYPCKVSSKGSCDITCANSFDTNGNLSIRLTSKAPFENIVLTISSQGQTLTEHVNYELTTYTPEIHGEMDNKI